MPSHDPFRRLIPSTPASSRWKATVRFGVGRMGVVWLHPTGGDTVSGRFEPPRAVATEVPAGAGDRQEVTGWTDASASAGSRLRAPMIAMSVRLGLMGGRAGALAVTKDRARPALHRCPLLIPLLLAIGLEPLMSAEATSVLGSGDSSGLPDEATTLLTSWDNLLVAFVLPIAAIGVGIITVTGSIQRLSATGLVGGVITAVLGVIGAMALPGIITGTGAASFVTTSLAYASTWSAALCDPVGFVAWAGVLYARRRH